jgi:hypothetical protein
MIAEAEFNSLRAVGSRYADGAGDPICIELILLIGTVSFL